MNREECTEWMKMQYCLKYTLKWDRWQGEIVWYQDEMLRQNV